jgi:cytochrome c-type biogenesis protein CcmH/NrfF
LRPLATGGCDGQIEDFVLARHAGFVLMQPTVRSDTYFLRFVAVGLLLLDGSAIGASILRAAAAFVISPFETS